MSIKHTRHSESEDGGDRVVRKTSAEVTRTAANEVTPLHSLKKHECHPSLEEATDISHRLVFSTKTLLSLVLFVVVWTLFTTVVVLAAYNHYIMGSFFSLTASCPPSLLNSGFSEDITEEFIKPDRPVNVAEDPTVDTTLWKSYKNTSIGFAIKYPAEWKAPVAKYSKAGETWFFRASFRSNRVEGDISNLSDSAISENTISSNDDIDTIASLSQGSSSIGSNVSIIDEGVLVGFDVVVYISSKITELSDVVEFPQRIDGSDDKKCGDITGHFAENVKYLPAQVFVPHGDDCYESAYFYTLVRPDYVYVIVPIVRRADGVEYNVPQAEERVMAEMPQFVAAASTFEPIDAVKSKPKITAPRPVSFKKDSLGRLVCEKGNEDKPGKSKQGKKFHLDMECCLDPDEYPNPWCYYPAEKYGEILKNAPRWPR